MIQPARAHNQLNLGQLLSSRASIIRSYSSGQNLYLDLQPFIGLTVADFPTQTTLDPVSNNLG